VNNSEKESFLNSIKYQWVIFLNIIFQPLFILAVILAILTMYLSYNTADKSLSIYLYILSGLLTSIVGAVYYDNFTNISGNTVLIKKGKGAVRNLFLLIDRIRNISARSKDNAADEEIRNLLGFIEKDVYNSIQEWTDVIPEIADVQAYTNFITEKENEINEIKNLLSVFEAENEELYKQANEVNGLKVEKEKLEKEKENLLMQLKYSELELSQIKHALNKAITASSTLTSLTTTSSTSGTSGVSAMLIDRDKVGGANLERLVRDSNTGRFTRTLK